MLYPPSGADCALSPSCAKYALCLKLCKVCCMPQVGQSVQYSPSFLKCTEFPKLLKVCSIPKLCKVCSITRVVQSVVVPSVLLPPNYANILPIHQVLQCVLHPKSCASYAVFPKFVQIMQYSSSCVKYVLSAMLCKVCSIQRMF